MAHPNLSQVLAERLRSFRSWVQAWVQYFDILLQRSNSPTSARLYARQPPQFLWGVILQAHMKSTTVPTRCEEHIFDPATYSLLTCFQSPRIHP